MTWDSGGAILLGSFGTVVLIWLGNLVVKHFTNNEDSADDAHSRINKLSDRITDFEREFLRSQTEIAKTYARISGVERMETSIFAVLTRLEDKIDNIRGVGANHHG